jgi:NitT/TauT family transport system permease protein
MSHLGQALSAAADRATPVDAAEHAIRQRVRSRKLNVYLGRAALFVFIVGGWQLFTTWKIVDPFFFGQPSGIVMRLKDWAEHGTAFGSIWEQIWVTMKEALLGFVFGVAGGVVFGVLLGQFRYLSDVFSPYIKAMNALPRIVLGSIFVVWLGLGTPSKVLLAAVLVFFVVFFNAYQGVREVDGNLINNARILGASRLALIRSVVLPSALTWIIASLHVAFGFSIIGAIVGEFLGAQQGLGLVIANSQNNFDPDGVFGAMLIIAVIALTAEWLIGLLERQLLAWRPQLRTESQQL